ncbi:stage V sporulation protein AE [Brevibacillus dissolubilis]|uniref:stage V sporulation protein AE n=1 Tax=Brevibacillus dissolubilis TaxID=1844116 RepID=UPI0011162CEB|nr:stage V sporulation protein AE [Brevibacillus dissolubilis]
MDTKRKVIIITDGDYIAQKAVEEIAKQIGGRCISLSAGNPTPLSGKQVVELIKQAVNDPVLVMFDDNGNRSTGNGEQAMEYVITHPDVEILGAIAVASNTKWVSGTHVSYSIDNQGRIIDEAVDKDGFMDEDLENQIYGDTVDILNKYNIPNVIGIGDIGKMQGKDHIRQGCPITRKAVDWILERSEYHGSETAREAAHHA